MTTLATFDVFLRADTSQFNRSMDSAKKSGQGFVANMASVAGGFLIANVAMGVLSKGIGMAGDALIGYNARMEQAQIGFTTLLGSAEKADAFVKQLQHFANVTPFDFPGLQKASTTMMAMGFTAQQVIPTLTAVGDVVSAMGKAGGEASESINRIVYNIGQMKQYGRVTGRDIRDLTMLGVPVVRILAQGFKVTTTAMQQMIAKGTVPADKAIRILISGIEHGNMGGMMAAQAKTFNGAMSTIQDMIGQLLGNGLKPLFDAIRDIVYAFSQWIQTPQIYDFIKTLSTAVRAFVIVLQTIIPTLLKVVSGMISFGAQTIGAFFKLVGTIVSAVEQLGKQLFTGGANAIQAFANGMYAGFQAYVTAVVQAIADFIGSFLIGASPPPKGPLSKIYDGGRNTIEAWVKGAMSADLSPILSIPDKVAKNLKKLDAASKVVADSISRIDSRVSILDLNIGKLQLTIDKITYSYQKQLDPLQHQYDLLMKTYTLEDKRRDLNLALKKNSLEQQMNAKKGDWWAQAQLQAQIDAIDQQETANSLLEEQQNLEAQIAGLPLEEKMQAITDQMDAALKPLEDQMKLLQMQRSELDYQRQVWQAIAADIDKSAQALRAAASASGHAAGGAGALKKGIAGGGIPKNPVNKLKIDPQLKIDAAKIEAQAQQMAKNFMDGVGNFIKSAWPTILGAIIGSMFGPVGTIVGAAIGTIFSGPIKQAVNDGIDALKGMLAGGAAGIGESFNLESIQMAVINAITGALDWLMNTGVPMAATAIGQFALAFINWVGDTVPKLLEALPPLVTNVLDWIATEAPIILGKLGEWTLSFISWILTDLIPTLVPKLAQIGYAIIGFITKMIPIVADKMVKLGQGLLLALVTFLNQLPPKMFDALVSMSRQLSQSMPDIVAKGLALAQALTDAITGVLKKLPGWIWDTLLLVLGKIGDFIPKGVSKMADLGGRLGKAFANSLVNLIEGAINAMIRGLNAFKIGPIDIDLGPLGHQHFGGWGGFGLGYINLPRFDKGAWPGLRVDTVAQLHKGEGVMPRSVMDKLTDLLDTGNIGSMGGVVVNGPLVHIDEFNGSQREVDDLMDKMASSLRLSKARA